MNHTVLAKTIQGIGWLTEQIKQHRLSFTLSVIMVIVYVFELYAVAIFGIRRVEPWITIGSPFEPSIHWILAILAHRSLSHLGKNVFIVLLWGSYVEEDLSDGSYLLFFFGIGIIAGFLHNFVTGGRGALGASGAALGLIVYFGITYLTEEWEGDIKFSNADPVKRNMAIVGLLIIPPVIVTDFFVQADSAGFAHLFGILFGLILGYLRLRGKSNSVWPSTDG